MPANPFAPPAAAPRAQTGLTEQDADMLVEIIAEEMAYSLTGVWKRLKALEADLAFAREQAAKIVEANLTRHLGEDDDD